MDSGGDDQSTDLSNKVEDQAGCEIILDTQKQCVSINNAESKGEFTFAIIDPAGNEEVTEMSIIAAAGTEKGLGIWNCRIGSNCCCGDCCAAS